MTDPLAHLYADLGDDVDDPPTVSTSIDALTSEQGAEEEISEADLVELVLLVASRLDEGRLPDEEAVELGLGAMVEAVGADLDRELVLNATGRAVLARLVDERFPGVRP